MFRQSIARAVPTLKSATSVQSRSYAKCTIIGRLGADPVEKTTAGDEGRSYWLYRLAVAKPVKKDAEGKVVRGEDGNPVRPEADWFSVFNFRENGKDVMPNLQKGDLVLVEASLQNRTTAEGQVENVLRENSIRVLVKREQAAQASA